jgi:hypothetical protein
MDRYFLHLSLFTEDQRMKKKFWKAVLIVNCLGMALSAAPSKAPAKESGTVLKVDYSGKQSCVYALSYVSKGAFKQKETTSTKSTSVQSVLSIAGKPENRFAMTIDSLLIASDLLNEETRKEIKDKALKSHATLSLVKGFPALDSGSESLATEYLEWNLYRQLLKLLPVLPDKPVNVGFTWERTFTVPLQTARGNIPCEIYRFFTLTKLQGDTAVINWKFTYTAKNKTTDSSDVLRHIPVSGKGNGSAVLDLRNHCILGAEMDFISPVGTSGDISVNWTEKASLQLKNCK